LTTADVINRERGVLIKHSLGTLDEGAPLTREDLWSVTPGNISRALTLLSSEPLPLLLLVSTAFVGSALALVLAVVTVAVLPLGSTSVVGLARVPAVAAALLAPPARVAASAGAVAARAGAAAAGGGGFLVLPVAVVAVIPIITIPELPFFWIAFLGVGRFLFERVIELLVEFALDVTRDRKKSD